MTLGEHDFVVVDDHDFVDFNATGILPKSSDDILKIQKWLQATDYDAESSEYNKHLASYVPGTSEWIQTNEQYQQWLHSSEHGTLWLKGVAGSGKSVIAAHVAATLAAEKTPVLKFFFRQIIATNKTPQSLLHDWLSQLLQFSPLLQEKLFTLLESRRSLDSMAFDELWDLLILALSKRPRTFCIVDAIDEMDLGNDAFIRKVIELGKTMTSTVKVLVTGRPLPYLEKALSDETLEQIPLLSRNVDPDIATYVRARLGQTTLSLALQSKIETTLRETSQGLFLYARLMLDELLELSNSLEAVTDALQKLPVGLSEMYTRMLHEHSTRSGTPQDLQLLILQSVTHASRPLRLLELAAMTDFVRQHPTDPAMLSEQTCPRDTKATIRRGCGPLLEILEDETISIIHHSLTEFLAGTETSMTESSFPSISSSGTHLTMAKLCVRYILASLRSLAVDNKDIERGLHSELRRDARMSFPFLEYAIKNFDYHILQTSTTDDDLFILLDDLFAADSEILSLYLLMLDSELKGDKTHSLHFIASKGLATYARHLVELGHDFNCLANTGRTPLHYAAVHGHADVVAVLLQCGAANNPDDRCGLTPLHLSARANHFKVVNRLLKSGVDPLTPKTKEDPGNWCGNAPRTSGETPMEYACANGHTETVIEFLPYLSIQGLSKAISWAVSCHNTDVVLQVLEDPRVDVNKVIDGKTALHVASHAHDQVCMTRLLHLGADPNIKCNNIFGKFGVRVMGPKDTSTFSAIHAYAQGLDYGRNEPVEQTLKGFEMLLDAGCDINEYDGYGQTILHTILGCYAKVVSVEVVRFLLRRGADPTLCSKSGLNPLHFGAGKSEEVVKLLISYGANLNTRGPDGRTPLHGAKNPDVLIQLGADCNIQDNDGNTPLHLAMLDPSIPKVKALLDGGSNPNAKNMKGDTALHISRSFQGDFLEVMATAGTDFEIKNARGLTILLQAVDDRVNLQELEELVDAGADIRARDSKGQTILHYCCVRGDADMIRRLVKRGADPLWKDYAGNSLLHQVAKHFVTSYGNTQPLLELLLDLGLSPSAQNNSGQTPFHIAASISRTDNRDTRWVMHTFDPFTFFLGPKCNLDVNTADHNGVRPIHFAASLAGHQVQEQLDIGADPVVFTLEGITPLHVACRSRQPNIVGMLIEEYSKRGQSHMIDHQDIQGRSALHYAVRSGQSESVALLLRLGSANANLKDGEGLAPLDLSTEIAEEDILWNTRSGSSFNNATSVKLSDRSRPWSIETGGKCGKPEIKAEADKASIREIVRLLVAHGADISFMINQRFRLPYASRSYNSFRRALDAGCETMADELLVLSKGFKTEAPTTKEHRGENSYEYNEPWNLFLEKYVLTRSCSSLGILQDLVKPGESNISIFNALLHAEDERGVAEFKRLGADLLKPEWNGESCITLLIRWGYSSLLQNHGQGAALMTKEWIKETEKTEMNLPGRLKPPLLIACERALPNIDIIKILIENFNADVNAKNKDGKNAVHLLAESRYWWQLSALEYLLQHGVDSETKNESLHIAIPCGRGEAAVKVLLQYGADPNCLDSEGMTCLNKAIQYPAIVRTLIKHGANVSAGNRPFVFDAIKALDVASIDILVKIGTDLNIKPAKEEEPVFRDNEQENILIYQQSMHDCRTPEEKSYPIHFAASGMFNTAEAKPKILPIIELLLRGGADPFLAIDEKGNSILHKLCMSNGIISPFLSLPKINLEARDSEGRTLLLAACSTASDYSDPNVLPPRLEASPVQLLIATGADVSVVDNEGKNALHHLFSRSNKCATRPYPLSDIQDFHYILSLELGHQLAIKKDNSGATPLHYALQNELHWGIDPLVAKGCDPVEPDPDGNNALHHVTKPFELVGYMAREPPPAIPFLDRFIGLGVNINDYNNLGETPIFRLVSGQALTLRHVKTLEQKGADLKRTNKKKQSLLHALAFREDVPAKYRNGNESMEACVFRYLMGKGLDAMAEDDESRTPLDIAVAIGNIGIQEIFQRGG